MKGLTQNIILRKKLFCEENTFKFSASNFPTISTMSSRLEFLFGMPLATLDPETPLVQLDVVRNYIYHQGNSKSSQPKNEVVKAVVKSIIDCWKNRNPPVYYEDNNRVIFKLVKKLVDKANALGKQRSQRLGDSVWIQEKKNEFIKIVNIPKTFKDVVDDEMEVIEDIPDFDTEKATKDSVPKSIEVALDCQRAEVKIKRRIKKPRFYSPNRTHSSHEVSLKL